jgi:hypothetical protein
VEPAHDVDLGDLGVDVRQDLVLRHRVGAGRAGLLGVVAEPARQHADVRRVELPVDGEVDAVAVPVARHGVGETAQLHDRRIEEPDAVLLRQALAGEQLRARGLDTGVARAEFGNVAQERPRRGGRG